MLTFAYPFTLIRALDGDTVEGYADLGFYISRRVTVRLNGVNAPEIHGDTEKEAGFLVKSCAEKWIAAQVANKAVLWLVSKEVDKYGRVLGEIEARSAGSPVTLSYFLLAMNLAQPYDGGTKHAYTAEELRGVSDRAKKYLA